MISSDSHIASLINGISDNTATIKVQLSNELVQLLSEQLYRSPVKAVEELVVNAYDADAKECRVYVPLPADQKANYILVFDNGIGMDVDGLEDLWQIGRSNKRSNDIAKRFKRKQIGKFGIGKLATYTICNKLTYLTRSKQEILFVSLDFSSFSGINSGQPVTLSVQKIKDWVYLQDLPYFVNICADSGVKIESLFKKGDFSWTFCILEELKEKVKTLTYSRLSWVLKTAMPLLNDFKLYLNGEQISRTEDEFQPILRFGITELPSQRLETLGKTTGEVWSVREGKIFSTSFHTGISGEVLITQRSLIGKSTDLSRSHGFFIRARGRLLNEEDAYFGITQSSYETFARFRANIDADDLDNVITAPREGIESSSLRDIFEKFLAEIFYEARSKYEEHNKKIAQKEERQKESSRNFVDPRLVEHPIADVLAQNNPVNTGSEADNTWFYLRLKDDADLPVLISNLYTQPRSKYKYSYSGQGVTERVVKFEPDTSTFILNSDHDFVKAYFDEGRSKTLLEDIVTAEVMLEIYLRENQVLSGIIGEVLEKRDALLKSLAKDHPFSLKLIALTLREASANEYELEIALVAAARALGFVATHIGGRGEPDGLAKFNDYRGGEKKITLEAKSSAGTPSLAAFDFAGLKEHVQRNKANGCLLIAPSYPGGDEDSAVIQRSLDGKISCWTIEQLAKIVEEAEARHITAEKVLDIVINYYRPQDVQAAIDAILRKPAWSSENLYNVIVEALKSLEGRLPNSERNISMISTIISGEDEFREITMDAVKQAAMDLASASSGLLTITAKDTLVVSGSYEELERRVAGITKKPGNPRRLGSFREE